MYIAKLIFILFLGIFALAQASAQSSGCVGTASITVTIEDCVGIEEVWNSANIELYPNPFRDAIHVVLPETMLHAPCQVSITDLSGRSFYSNSAQQSTVLIPTSNLPKGMYIVSVQSSTEKYRRKIVKY